MDVCHISIYHVQWTLNICKRANSRQYKNAAFDLSFAYILPKYVYTIRTGISTIVSKCPHVDHISLDLDVVVTEHGLSDLRGLTPREKVPRADCSEGFIHMYIHACIYIDSVDRNIVNCAIRYNALQLSHVQQYAFGIWALSICMIHQFSVQTQNAPRACMTLNTRSEHVHMQRRSIHGYLHASHIYAFQKWYIYAIKKIKCVTHIYKSICMTCRQDQSFPIAPIPCINLSCKNTSSNRFRV